LAEGDVEPADEHDERGGRKQRRADQQQEEGRRPVQEHVASQHGRKDDREQGDRQQPPALPEALGPERDGKNTFVLGGGKAGRRRGGFPGRLSFLGRRVGRGRDELLAAARDDEHPVARAARGQAGLEVQIGLSDCRAAFWALELHRCRSQAARITPLSPYAVAHFREAFKVKRANRRLAAALVPELGPVERPPDGLAELRHELAELVGDPPLLLFRQVPPEAILAPRRAGEERVRGPRHDSEQHNVAGEERAGRDAI
jgi:hypothetical protein